jgi:hypothetical protein
MSAPPEPDAALAARRYADEFARHGPIEVVQPTKLQALAAEKLQETWGSVPHVTHSRLVDITDLETARVPSSRWGLSHLGIACRAGRNQRVDQYYRAIDAELGCCCNPGID